MKLLLVFLFVAAAAAQMDEEILIPSLGMPSAEAPNSRADLPIWGIFAQKQDNFDGTNENEWLMRYIKNGQFFTPGSPIFIMLGGESAIDDGWLRNGQMFDMAEIHNAQMFYTEHRYYGESIPTEDLKTANLRFLTIDQTLADVANFIITMKANNADFSNSKVVVFGGSYAGALATWMRQKYPHLVHAAVASSAPLLAQANFHEYNDVIKDVLGSKCSSVFMNGSKQLLKYMSNGNIPMVKYYFNICENGPFANEYDVQTLFQYLIAKLGAEIQYAGPNTVADMCNKLTNTTSQGNFLEFAAYFKTEYCRYNYDFSVRILANYRNGNIRLRFYRLCTNFGFFQTSWADNALFNLGISADYYNKKCADVFGLPMSTELIAENIAATNQRYGGLKPAVTRVISIHGGNDPWHPLGLPASDNPAAPAYVVPLASHCQDMYSLNSTTSTEMTQAKQAVLKYVAAWLNEP